MEFQAGISIDGVNITDQGRKGINAERDERSVIVELANGTRKKYIKKVARIYNVSWEMLPGSDDFTVDGNVARDWLFANLSQEGATHTIVFRHQSGSSETITAFVISYSEELVLRRTQDFFWNVSITLEEQ